MPAAFIWILGGLGPILQSVVGRVLLALGVGIVTFGGVDLALDQFRTKVFTELAGLPAIMLDVLSLLRVDQAILTIFSALAGALAVRGVNGAVSKWVLK